MKLGGLFSGIGGFELAWTRLGGEVAWMCEWDKNARKVLAERFPGVPIYEDVRDLDPAEVEPVDVLTGGSPCQGFSVAGKRTGMEHEESQLFSDYIRIMDGLAERGLKWALWENVPGVLSIKNPDGERTFTHVIGALVGGSAPVRLDPRRKWNTGLASGSGRAVAWRVLDSRYFGVAQRRRRIFACVAFGGACEDRAGRTLLAVAEGVRGDSAEGVAAGEGAAGGVEGRAGVPSVTGAVTSKWAKGTGGPSGDEAQNLVTDTPKMLFVRGGVEVDSKGRKAGKGPLMTDNEAATLDAGNHWTLFQPQAFRKSRRAQSTQDAETWVDDGMANTVNTFDVGDARTTHAIVEPVNSLTPWPEMGEAMRVYGEDGAGPSLKQHSPNVMTAHETGQGWWNEADHAGTLRAEGENRPSRPSNVAVMKYGVRRLTPVECERLQAFPDGWTEPAGSDSARYKALGNAVTVNTVGWILRRMKAQG